VRYDKISVEIFSEMRYDKISVEIISEMAFIMDVPGSTCFFNPCMSLLLPADAFFLSSYKDTSNDPAIITLTSWNVLFLQS
jgi:hypothetical protein